MTAISLETAQAKLDMWLEALDAVATGQSYTINGRTLSRASLSQIESQIKFWEKRVTRARRGGITVRGGIVGE